MVRNARLHGLPFNFSSLCQMLKRRLAMAPEVVQKAKPENPSSIGCTFCLEAMLTSPWIESWIDTLPILDHRRIVHELNLLLDLSRSILLPSDEEVQLVRLHRVMIMEFIHNRIKNAMR